MTLSERLAAARKHAGLTQADLARAAGITQQSIHQLESGRSLRSTKLTEIAIACGVSPVWLSTGIGAMVAPPQDQKGKEEDESDWADVTGWSQAAGLGTGAEAQEYAETHSLKFKKNSLRRRGILGSDLAVYYGKGDSMEPTIKDGDAILFDTSDTRPVDGHLYLIQVDGAANAEYYVKRAEILDGIVFFRSDNPTGDHNWRKPRRMDSTREPITIIGRVQWIGGWAF
uniref:XRE family transcriptional regulator n=1 Tax=Xanthomonas sp. 0924 TaxID=2835534 RepID=UPI003F7E8285